MKYLDLNGVKTLWNQIKLKFVAKEEGKGLSTNDLTNELKSNYDKAYTHSQSAHAPTNAQANVIESVKVNGTALTPSSKAVNIDLSEYAKTSGVTKSAVGLGNVTNDAQVKRSEMGVASGVATLGTDGKVPSSQLPSYVDDVLEYDAKANFPTTGESGKIYIDKATNKTYRWGGTTYVVISQSLTLGETSSTAYAGDKGATNASNISKIIDGTQVVGKATTATNVNGYTVATNVPSGAKFTDTTYGAMTGASATADGASGLVPKPTKGNENKYLRADGTWQTPPNTTYDLSGYVKASDLQALTEEEIINACA